MTEQTTIIGTIIEMGDGLPAAGELIGYWDDGEPVIYRVGEGVGSIQTYASGRGNDCRCYLTPLDAEDVASDIDLGADDLGLRHVGIELDD